MERGNYVQENTMTSDNQNWSCWSWSGLIGILIFFFQFYSFISLAVLGLSCSMWNLVP